MPAIHAPSPRLPSLPSPSHSELLSQNPSLLQQTSLQLLSSSRTLPARTFLSPPRLLSPITLNEPPYIPLTSKSPTLCGLSHKRRAQPRISRSTRRRRHTHRVDCSLDPFPRASVFDHLPWISALEIPRAIDCDIADLSQIPLNEDPATFTDSIPASGPVRRRKTSLRSNPIGIGHETLGGELHHTDHRQFHPYHKFSDVVPDCPKTPPPRFQFDPSRVTFHNLMPVFPDGNSSSVPFRVFSSVPGSP